MLPSFLSPTHLYGQYLRRRFITAGLTSQTVNLNGEDETKIQLWAPDPAQPKTLKKPALVLIHGFGPVSTWQWQNQVQYLAPKFDLYIPDLIFFGESTTRSSDRSEQFQAAAVAGVMEKMGVERYSILGTSYGGIVAYNVAKRWGERVVRVVIASSGLNMKREDGVELLKRGKVEKTEELMLPATAKQMRNLLSLAVYRRPKMLPDLFLNDMLHKLYSDKRMEKMELLKGLTIGKDDQPQISPLEMEVLLIWGDHDQIFPVEMAIELKELLGKKVKLEIIKKTSHVPQSENPALFNSIVNNFLCEST
ncbi:uncharacterized protein LOC115706050 [Cannabis sativa]|uniref:uncharacterized protein LOC115706050 n=1 Tax=Cannabis sativa TaxID=3483 RepID=UPI0029CA0533|nr:uncharacterized protein LOC115706050 [Cannabis sativa]